MSLSKNLKIHSTSEKKKRKNNANAINHCKLLVFGYNKDHQLISENKILTKPQIVSIETSCIRDVACGLSHSVFCLCDGSILCAGDNTKFQFGKKDIKSKFEKIKSSKEEKFIQVFCGSYYSMAITENGKLFSWGFNENNELGQNIKDKFGSIAMVKSLDNHRIIQVACGTLHCLALSTDSIIWSWGKNDKGQLGIDIDTSIPSNKNFPTQILGLSTLPILKIGAGDEFSVCLSFSGSVFTWGCNKYCQLGVGMNSTELTHSHQPVNMKSMKDLHIVNICCGAQHAVLLTTNGGVFAFGRGNYGQLGLSDLENQSVPRQVPDLMGSVVTQISCGENFTLAYVPKSQKIYGFGSCKYGELGHGISESIVNSPKEIKLSEFLNFKRKSTTNSLKGSEKADTSEIPRKMVSGLHHSIILLTDKKHPNSEDFRKVPNKYSYSTINFISSDLYSDLLKNKIKINNEFKIQIYSVFNSLACLSSSFLDNSDKNSHFRKSKLITGIDIEAAFNFQKKFVEILNKDEIQLFTVHIYENLLSGNQLTSNYPAIESLRGFLILLLSVLHNHSECYENISVPLYRCINVLATIPHTIFESWLSLLKPRYFKKIVEAAIKLVNHHVDELPPGKNNDISQKATNQMSATLDFLKTLYVINERSKLISFSTFYVTNIYDKVDIERNFIEWATANTIYQPSFSFCSYPFIFDGKSKTRLLQVEASLFMRNAILETHTNLLMSILNAATQNPEGLINNPQLINMENPFFVIGVNRDTVLEDTIKQLQRATQKDFKKPLKISFSNEEAVDDGGVVKEYFLLVIRELMLPKRRLFRCYNESNMCYFQQNVTNKNNIYRCVGQLCGLAIYNGVIVDLHFPLALFKKLLGEIPELDDLIELDPVIGKSFQQILDYHGNDFSDIFGITHEVTWTDVDGKIHHTEQFRKGKSTPVTLDTKEQYVLDYIQFILTDNVEASFNSFKMGFYLVAVGSVIKLFRPIELQEMTVGLEISDWDELQMNAKYEGEYWIGHNVIKWFWEVFREINLSEKRKFLRFLTGCDRAPITGMADFKIVIQPTNGGDKYYPVAHTCYNLMDLPKYSSKSILKNRLLTAIDHTEGFTLV